MACDIVPMFYYIYDDTLPGHSQLLPLLTESEYIIYLCFYFYLLPCSLHLQ